MAKLTLAQLERHLNFAADILPEKMAQSERKDIIFGLLFLKRCSDEFQPAMRLAYDGYLATHGDADEAAEYAESAEPYGDHIFVPPAARWWRGPHRDRATGEAREYKGLNQLTVADSVAADMDKALLALEGGPNATSLSHVLRHIQFSRQTGQTRLTSRELVELIRHFDRYSLREADFEFPGMLGAVYESLIGRFAELAGAKGGDFYTPRSIVRMMVRLVDPRPRDRVYDPCAGSAGMLLLAREHVEEHGGDPDKLALFGQEISGTTWAMARMNLLLHGVRGADLRNGDTLVEPLHKHDSGKLLRFHKILSNPKFSLPYKAAEVRAAFPDRMRFGWAAESDQADLMFVQHMVSVLTEHGVAATVMPHGVLFRAGEERTIRINMLNEDVIEAVIGLGPNLFYRGSPAACVLLLRSPGGKIDSLRQNRVLFINADREYTPGRAQNHLRPEHAEKIVSTFRGWLEIPGYSRVVAVEDLLAEDANLNIRRYVDSAPPPEAQDVSAHLDGGMPKIELTAEKSRFAAYGIDVERLFVEWQPADPDYCDFQPEDSTHTGERIVDMAAARVEELRSAYRRWWGMHAGLIAELATHQRLMTLREAVLDSFTEALVPVRVLDRFTVAGIVAGWWMDNRHDLKALAAGGFDRVLDGWADTVEAMLEPVEQPDGKLKSPTAADRRKAREHPVIPHLLPHYLAVLEKAEAASAETESAYQAARAAAAVNGTEDADTDQTVTQADLARAKKARTAANATRNKLEKLFREQLRAAVMNTKASGEAGDVVLRVFDEDLAARLDRYVSAGRERLVETYRRWSDKYRVSLSTLEAERDAATRKLDDHLAELGYRRGR